MSKETIHVGVLDVICKATFTLGDEGALHVAVMDGVREFELEAWEVERLYLAIRSDRLKRLGKESL